MGINGPRMRGMNGPRMCINGPCMGMNGPRMGMNGPRMCISGPRMGINGPRMGINGPRMGINGPRMGMNGPRMGINGQRMGMNGPRMGINGPRMSMNGLKREITFLLAGIRYISRFALGAVVTKIHLTNIFKNELTTCPKSNLPKMHMVISFFCNTNGRYAPAARKPVFGFPVRSYQNQPAQLQRQARIVKFRLEQVLV